MRKTSIAIATLALLLALGCNKTSSQTAYNAPSNDNPTVAQGTNLSPEELGKLGAEIKKHPKDAQKLLSEKGLNEQQFEQAIRKVSENPDEAKRYAAAYKKSRA